LDLHDKKSDVIEYCTPEEIFILGITEKICLQSTFTTFIDQIIDQKTQIRRTGETITFQAC
jgi:hypothetical protein